MHTAKFTIEAYLAEYLQGKWGTVSDDGVKANPITIPLDVDYLRVSLVNLTQITPRNAKEEVANIEIVIPHIREINKKPERYNYISHRGAKIFNKLVKQYFKSDLHHYLDTKVDQDGLTYKDACYMFVSEFNIQSYEPESLYKDQSRWKSKVRLQRTKRAYTTR